MDMSYSPRKRDRYRLAVAAVSGLATFGALTASGLIAGAAAQGYEADQAATTAQKKAELIAWKQAKVERKAIIKASKKYYAQLAKQAAHPKVIVRQRPQETHVTTQYLSSGGSGYVGSGGNVYTGGSTSSGGRDHQLGWRDLIRRRDLGTAAAASAAAEPAQHRLLTR